jgi:CO/xanthine dehydrogenase FAD-binding subunit
MPVEPPVETPLDLPAALAAMAGPPPATAIAGGTDLLVRITGEIREPPARVVDVWQLAELRGIALDRGELVLGALSTYIEIRRSALCREHLPVLVEAAATIGAAQIQNRGTLGGNLANASPAGDTLPVLLAAGATIDVRSVRGERAVAIDDFFVGYRRTALEPDELIVRIRVPLVAGREVRFRKVGTRRAQAISKVVAALAWREHGRAAGWSDVRLALGSIADRPVRAPATEAILEGARPTPETADLATETLAAEIAPIDDVRSTADYRRVVAARVVHRLIRDAGGW